MNGNGFGLFRADHFEKNGSDLVSEFGQGFYNNGLQMMTHWDRSNSMIEVDITTHKVGAKSYGGRDEKFYALRCSPLAGERG